MKRSASDTGTDLQVKSVTMTLLGWLDRRWKSMEIMEIDEN